jgi:hypothetical protein
MNIKNVKNRRWVYAFAGLALTLVCLLTTVVVYQRFPNLPGALEEQLDIDELTQLVVPGSVDIDFAKSGAYGVYYEYRSVVNDAQYDTGKQPPSLICSLTSKTTGARINAVPDFVEKNTYRSKDQQRVGVLLMSMAIDNPGRYNFMCQYGDDRAQPKIVVAVGPNLMWEFFNSFAKIGGSFLCGAAGLFLAGFVGLFAVVFIAVKRNQTMIKQ